MKAEKKMTLITFVFVAPGAETRGLNMIGGTLPEPHPYPSNCIETRGSRSEGKGPGRADMRFLELITGSFTIHMRGTKTNTFFYNSPG